MVNIAIASCRLAFKALDRAVCIMPPLVQLAVLASKVRAYGPHQLFFTHNLKISLLLPLNGTFWASAVC